MVDTYYGESGMYDAFNALSRKYAEKRAGGIASAADHVTVLDIPDTTAWSEPVNPISGRRSHGTSYNNSPLKPRGSNVGSKESSSSNSREVPSFVIANSENTLKGLGGTEEGTDYERLDPERNNPYADTNGSENASLNWSAVTSPVTGETVYKRPIRGIV